MILVGVVGFVIYLKVKEKGSSVAPVARVEKQASVKVPIEKQASVKKSVPVKKQPVEKEVGYDAVAR